MTLSRPARALAATVPVVALLSSPAAAATLCVKPGDGNGCQATITAALTAAQDGDTVRVAQGTYVEFVTLDKTVVLEGGWNAAFTARDPAVFVSTIQPPPSPAIELSVVSIAGPASPTLDGFTITGGRADLDFNHGGGVSIRFGSAAVLRDNLITGNSAYLFGGGVWIQSSAVRLERNRIEDNTAVGDGAAGGGVNVESGAVTLISNVIARNQVPGAFSKGGGVVIFENGVRFVNNTVDANDAEGVFSDSPITFSNNIVTGHLIGLDLQTCPSACAGATVTFNDFFANTANTAGWTLDGTNLLVDPLLTADHHLTSASTLIDAGTHAGAPAFDLDGESRVMAGPSGLFRPDIGADEYTGAAQRVVDLDTDSADLTLIGPGGIPSSATNGVNDWIGFATLAADVNGDGRDDLVTSAEDWAVDPDNEPRTTGRLFGVFNSGQRVTGTLDLLATPADLTVACTLNLQHIGSALVSGDLDGDGVRDLIVGSFQDDNAGGGAVFPTVYVFRGGPSLTGTRTLGASSPADFALQAPGQDFFAFSGKNALATGDVNGDGVADLLVGDALANDGATAGAGAIFVMFGGSGLAGFRDLAVTPADYTLYGSVAAAGLGTLAVGRVNAGAQLDLVARTDTAAFVILGPLPVPGPTSATTAAASITITGLQAPANSSGSLLVADVTGDGADDIVLASGNDLLVVPGPLLAGETFDAASRAVLTVTEAYASALASADLTGDGKRDLIIGARQRRQAVVVAGGSFTGSHPALDIAVTVVRSGFITFLGWDVSAGDLDFDSGADLVVGTFGADVAAHPAEFTDAGLVFVIYGAPPLPSLSINDVTVAEGTGGTSSAVFTVVLSAASTQTITVGYSTANVTATAPGDYTAATGTLTFPAGTLSETITVAVATDTTPEADETFVVNLSSPVNATLADAQGTGTITDDDGAATGPRITISDRSVREGAAVNAAFLLTLSPATQQTVTVNYATADGTAKAGTDYTLTSGVLTFTPGRTTQTLFVPIATDTTAEGTEQFFMNLSGPTNATIVRGQAVGTIEDPPAAAAVPMYRSYNRATDYHFFTTSLASKEFAVNVLGFQDESDPLPFYVLNTHEPGTEPLFRMYNPNLGRHYYTAEVASRDFLISIGMVYELDEGFIYPVAGTSGTTELYRLYNNNSGTHLFTASVQQRDAILAMFPGIWVPNTSVGYVLP